jgi:ABC-type antimicrobial peptide transport system permease subunit
MLKQVPPSAYGRADVGVDFRVVLAALGMGLACALSFSIVPAWRAAGADVIALIQRRGGRGSRVGLGRPLVAVQVAIATAVVFGAIVAGRAFLSILQIPVGFSSDRVALVSIGFPAGATGDERRAAYDRVLQTLLARADVASAGAAGALPFSGRAPDEGVRSDPRGPLQAGLVYALPGYFDTLSIPVLRGRTWSADDVKNDPDGAVVSLTAARALFGERDPIGATFTNGRDRTFHVIGVVADVRNFIDREFPPQAYILPPAGRGLFNIVVKTRERTAATLASIKADMRRTFPAGLTTVTWWDADIAATEAYRNPRFQTIVLGGLATLALGLTGLGIFSVVAYLVAARRREMGVRLAIGASPSALVALVIRESLVPVAMGLGFGVLLINWGRGLAEAQLFDIETTDPMAFGAAAMTVFAAAAAAAFVPARRAPKIKTTVVLTAE